MTRPGPASSSMVAKAMAVAVGVRAPICTTLVPRRILEVTAAR